MLTINDDDDKKTTETYYVPCVDDKDPEMDEIQRYLHRGETTFIDLTLEEVTKDISSLRITDSLYERLEREVTDLRNQVDRLTEEVVRLTKLVETNRDTTKVDVSPGTLICVSGKFEMEHHELANLIRSKGMRYNDAVTQECGLLIVPSLKHKSQKTEFANRYNVPIRDYAFLSTLESK